MYHHVVLYMKVKVRVTGPPCLAVDAAITPMLSSGRKAGLDRLDARTRGWPSHFDREGREGRY